MSWCQWRLGQLVSSRLLVLSRVFLADLAAAVEELALLSSWAPSASFRSSFPDLHRRACFTQWRLHSRRHWRSCSRIVLPPPPHCPRPFHPQHASSSIVLLFLHLRPSPIRDYPTFSSVCVCSGSEWYSGIVMLSRRLQSYHLHALPLARQPLHHVALSHASTFSCTCSRLILSPPHLAPAATSPMGK